MSDRLKNLLTGRKISRYEYLTYLVFTADDVGKEYLRLRCDMAFMEEPVTMGSDPICWHDGRRSIWREIRMIIDRIESLIREEENNDRRN